ncbi:mucosa-associated lymphoid tissue lymphoma translocation protein 1 [Synchiropus picturatus]
MISDIVIVHHPVSACVPVNHLVTLSVRAESTGDLNYQWFTDDECEVWGETKADLTIKARKTQCYVCRVNNHSGTCVFSDWVKVKVHDIQAAGLPAQWQGDPHIVINPTSVRVQPAANVTLSCVAYGKPAPQYQWYKNGLPLFNETSDTLQIDGVTAEHKGSYLCSVSNVLKECWSDAAEVDVVLNDRPTPAALTASDKVALLIGNLNYNHHPSLMAPVMDVHELANLLQHLGFRVVSLLDLTKEEMQAAIEKFIQLLDRGVYGLFYYAGHGYEHAGRNYLVAIDTPQPYRPENCVCVQRVMLKMQDKETALNIVLLDTCRKWCNQGGALSAIRPQLPKGNTVYGFATCEDAEAFEVQDGRKSTGIFTKYLNKHILEVDKVTHVLEKVSEDLGRDQLVTDKQAVEVKHTLKEPRSLADPVHTKGHTRELHRREACWRQANELPKKKRLVFLCGAEVQISFSALFSNVLVVFAKVKATGLRTQDCTVRMSSKPTMEDMFSGSGAFEEVDSLMSGSTCNSDCTLRLCGLQKLKHSLVIQVDLHFTHTKSLLRLTESQKLAIGKPLVASCDLFYRKYGATAARQHDAVAATQSMDKIASCKGLQKHPMAGTCRPFTRKAECQAKVGVTRWNQPEENDENELCQAMNAFALGH